MKLITIAEAHQRIKEQIHVGSDEQYINLLKSQNAELGDLVRKLRAENQNLQRSLDDTRALWDKHSADLTAKNQNLFDALMESTKAKYELHAKIKSARGHMNLYRLFSCEGGDSYDPECAEKNLDKVQEILK